MTPTISILVTTYNRKDLLRRCLDNIFAQTFSDYELVIIDDASTDGTHDFLDFLPDKRLRLFRNEKNKGAEHGDRIHIQRFVNELARGKYFIYCCDDDYLMFDTLLARQVALFEAHPSLSMVTGGQMSFFAPREQEVYFSNALPAGFSTSDEFLDWFCEKPITSNIITGARLYDRKKFIKSGAMQESGSKWQAGYEMTLAPACYGDHYYINEPCIFTDIQPYNASFRGTQYSHYIDSIASLRAAFRQPMLDFPERILFDKMLLAAVHISEAYLANARTIRMTGKLTDCSAENIARPVTIEDVNKVLKELQGG